MATGDLRTPETPHLNSPVAFVHPKLTDRGSYVQRWKALRDRNRNLPKLDFNTKLAATMQRQSTKANIGITRSLTLDSMKLPSIANGSVTNGSIYTTKSNKETTTKKSGVQETESILSDSKTINGALSKSLPNVANAGTQDTANSNKHRYERIAQQKRLIKRYPEKKENQQLENQHLEQSGIYQLDINDEFDTDKTGGEMSQRFSKNTIGTILEHEALSGRNSRQTRFRLQNDVIGRRSRRKKWRDDCKCMRCEIMHRQYEEKDDHYTKWGIYPCQQHLARQKFYKQYFYDSD